MRFRRRKTWLLLIPFLAAGAWFASSAVIYATSIKVYLVPSKSMSPTLAPGDRICVDTRRGFTPKRGELWVLSTPKGWTAVKRVIGLPGETLEVAGGKVLIDGHAPAEPYLAGPISYTMPPVRLEAGQFFVLGDSRNASNDSHVWGPLEGGRLIGRVDFRPWPPSRIGGLR
jgi:signal peptidase I